MARFVLNVIFILNLHVYLVSCRGVKDQIMPTNVSCQLDIEGAKAMEVIQREGSVYINMDLKFVNSFGVEIDQILDDTDSTIVNIKRWVLAIGPKGVQLLKYPSNAVLLSLGTLQPGVERVSLNVSMSKLSMECFFNASDSEKLAIIATSLGRFQSREGLQLDQAICLERQDILFFFDCWRLVILNEHYKDENNQISLVLACVSWIMAQYISFFILSFICRNSPLLVRSNDRRIEYISLSTDLPIGPKYFLFFKNNEIFLLYMTRCCLLFAICLYFPWWMAIFTKEKELNYQDTIIFMYINVFIITLFVPMLVWPSYKSMVRANEEDIEDNLGIFLNYVKLFAPPINLRDPDQPLYGVKNARDKIKQIMDVILTTTFWKGVWKKTNEDHGCAVSLGIFFVKSILTVIFINPVFLLMVYFSSIHKNYLSFIIRPVGAVLVRTIYGLGIVSLLMISFCFMVFYLLSIFYYFFIGLLINSSYIYNEVLFNFFIIGYVFTTITEYYACYVNLLRQVIDTFEAVIEKHDGPINSDLYKKNLDGYSTLTYIKKNFFNFIITKYRPYSYEGISIIMRLSICCILVMIAITTLTNIDQISNVSTEVQSIAYVFIPFVIPIFYKMIKNEAQEINEERALKARIEHDIKNKLEIL